MTNHTLNIVSLCLALAGCGGSAFDVAAATDGDAGPGGIGGAGSAPEADGGTPAPGAGGAGGRLGTVLGGGGVTPGTGGVTTATGGVTAGTGGAEPGGSGGAAATGGAGTGGATVGTGGAPTCNPPVIRDTDLPTTIIWDSYLGQDANTGLCLTCAHSPCTTCPVTWWPVSQSADGRTLTAKAAVQCDPIAMNLTVCTSVPGASTCTTTWPTATLSATFEFELLPKADGTGWTTSYRTFSGGTGSSYALAGGICQGNAYQAAVQENEPFYVLLGSTRDTLGATEWPCGG